MSMILNVLTCLQYARWQVLLWTLKQRTRSSRCRLYTCLHRPNRSAKQKSVTVLNVKNNIYINGAHLTFSPRETSKHRIKNVNSKPQTNLFITFSKYFSVVRHNIRNFIGSTLFKSKKFCTFLYILENVYGLYCSAFNLVQQISALS